MIKILFVGENISIPYQSIATIHYQHKQTCVVNYNSLLSILDKVLNYSYQLMLLQEFNDLISCKGTTINTTHLMTLLNFGL